MLKVGVIGCGNRICNLLRDMYSFNLGVTLTAVTDVKDPEEVIKMLTEFKISTTNINFYDSADEMLDSEKFDGVMVGTRCSTHTENAIKVLKKGIPLFLEKPVSTTMEDLISLKEAGEQFPCEVVVSFPLRYTPLLSAVKKIIDSGELGTIEHVAAFNYVPYGAVYYQNWYRNEKETGGLFLQKATHDFDYINYLLQDLPVEICATISKQIFKGDKEENLFCEKCNEYETCPQSPFYIEHISYDGVQGNMCAFAKDTGNQDSGSALVKYSRGMHMVYTQNFFVKKSAAKRGAILAGYNGTVEFDWYTNEVKVHMHHKPETRTYKIDTSSMTHSGGDSVLLNNFINVMRGAEKSCAPLETGVLSALMCLKANRSVEENRFVKIEPTI
jgi:predicted dehydrogenase